MRKQIPIFLFLLAVCYPLFGQSNQALNRFVANKIFRNSGLSVAFSDAKNGKIVASYNPNLNLTPASTLKLITTATALEVFGADYRFETNVAYSGKIVGNVLIGDLYVIGHGDPTLGSAYSQNSRFAFFDTIFAALKKLNVTELKGRIIADESAYNSELIPPKTPWEDMGNYYAAGVSALNFGDNSYKLTFKTGAVGSVPEIIDVDQSIKGLTFENHLTTKANDKDSAFLYGMPYSGERSIYGSVPSNRAAFTIKGDVPDPAQFLVSELSDYLVKNGIKCTKGTITSRKMALASQPFEKHLIQLCRFQSDKLSYIVKVTNKRSYNFYAEALLRLLASKYSTDASLMTGVAALKSFWAQKGLDVGFLMYDGSGLSPANRVNAAFFVQLLKYMDSKSENKEAFFASLAVAGVDGTLKSFLSSTNLCGKVRAKSGSFDGVLSYCGTLSKEHKDLYFCIIANAFTCPVSDVKRAIEQLLVDF